jgi:hypothetical protein
MRDFVRFPHIGLPNTSSLRRLCNIFARPSHPHSYCGVVRSLLFLSNKHGDCLKECAARVRARRTKYTSPTVLESASCSSILGAEVLRRI